MANSRPDSCESLADRARDDEHIRHHGESEEAKTAIGATSSRRGDYVLGVMNPVFAPTSANQDAGVFAVFQKVVRLAGVAKPKVLDGMRVRAGIAFLLPLVKSEELSLAIVERCAALWICAF